MGRMLNRTCGRRDIIYCLLFGRYSYFIFLPFCLLEKFLQRFQAGYEHTSGRYEHEPSGQNPRGTCGTEIELVNHSTNFLNQCIDSAWTTDLDIILRFLIHVSGACLVWFWATRKNCPVCNPEEPWHNHEWTMREAKAIDEDTGGRHCNIYSSSHKGGRSIQMQKEQAFRLSTKEYMPTSISGIRFWLYQARKLWCIGHISIRKVGIQADRINIRNWQTGTLRVRLSTGT